MLLPRVPIGLATLACAAILGACTIDPPAPVAASPSAPIQTEAASSAVTQSQAPFSVDVQYHTLENGLKVVLSEDASVPSTTIGVYYGIGFRIEPQDRTGFAHLFEHMMFQGSANLGKNEFIGLVNSNGGVLNGSTRFDFTNYFEVVPSHKTETFIWAEADRMRGLDITQENLTNQQGVVKSEVRVNVLNQPYGGFPWLDLPQLANDNWYNAHNFYGDLEDLDAATLEDVQSFFDEFYAPNNAVVVIAGDIDADETLGWVNQYFGNIPASEAIPSPDISEDRQTEERRLVKTDPLAPQPALAFGYHMPERGSPEYYAMIVLDQILAQGDDSRLNALMVQQKGYTSSVNAAINFLGNAYNYNGPMQWAGFMIHGTEHDPETIIADLDAIIADVQNTPIGAEEFNRAMTKFRSSLYDTLGDGNRVGLVDMLAVFALFDDDPGRVNSLVSEFDIVTPELIQKTAQEYLRPTNRSIITLVPGAGQ